MSRQRYKLIVSYDGTAYAGWQVQPNAVTVQHVIEDALATLAGRRVILHGSGRTDRGVHARGQVAHFDADIPVPLAKLAMVLNSLIPGDIRILSAQVVAPDFHARRRAVAKEYRYFIVNKRVMDPFKRLYSRHVRRPLDLAAMRRAAKLFVGRHDFRAFTANPKVDVASHVRAISHVKITEMDGEVCIAVKGSGFLYKMVRSMVGYLIRVGAGEVSPESVLDVMASKTRTSKVPTAPASGLFLWKVWY